MYDGYVAVAAATPGIRVADCEYNADRVEELMDRADGAGASVLCLPELCLTGYTCGELFLQEELRRGALAALRRLVARSADCGALIIAGLPLAHGGKLYNVAAVFSRGALHGFVPKTHLPNYGEFYEMRHFCPAPRSNTSVRFDGTEAPFGAKLLFECESMPELTLAVEICEDLWAPSPPSASHAEAGATVIANLSASNETVGKAAYRRSLAAGQSGRLLCGYIYADAGFGESTTDMVFAGHNLICENGAILAQSRLFGDEFILSELDLRSLAHDRLRMTTFGGRDRNADGYDTVAFGAAMGVKSLTRKIDPHPFVPEDGDEKSERCEEILNMQTSGLAARLRHLDRPRAVVGVSGGLDSCLALLVTARAFEKLGMAPDGVIAVTMPCFGTTERTKGNAHTLMSAVGATCLEIDVTDAVRRHLRDIGHPEDARDTVYENAQARARTLVLMDLANKHGGIVVGTGDLSELALGWATYNGDHMSMYGVNSGVPKTLIRHIVGHVADTSPELRAVLRDILATPVSPELLPPDGGGISQRTEELIGPYELHDFFLYHVMRKGRTPSSVLELAALAFHGVYGRGVILRWLRVFYSRFFSQQFKRSCLPDGPKIGSVTLSPRGDWRMPSDASPELWLRELDALGQPADGAEQSGNGGVRT
ncbi:MAG: NAD(+) synthase [Oscillospiraceae bacterium]|jgi:NAD+ synthase (glutamine-hydrolysing)|nr:NAD(+) synthase [Oscillospiraceae bacterium]